MDVKNKLGGQNHKCEDAGQCEGRVWENNSLCPPKSSMYLKLQQVLGDLKNMYVSKIISEAHVIIHNYKDILKQEIIGKVII